MLLNRLYPTRRLVDPRLTRFGAIDRPDDPIDHVEVQHGITLTEIKRRVARQRRSDVAIADIGRVVVGKRARHASEQSDGDRGRVVSHSVDENGGESWLRLRAQWMCSERCLSDVKLFPHICTSMLRIVSETKLHLPRSTSN